jgi:hypothetical protein
MKLQTLLKLGVIAVFATGLASADIITTTNATTVGPTLTDFGFSLVFGSTLTPAGFHLVGATLEVTDAINDSVLSLTNNAGTTQIFQFIATSKVHIMTNSVDGVLVGSESTPATVLDTGLVSFNAGQTTNYAPVNITATIGPVSVGSAYLGGLTLGGVTLSGTTFVGGGGNIAPVQTQSSTIDGVLIFDFAPDTQSPEPATLALLGSALIGLGVVRRRRKVW